MVRVATSWRRKLAVAAVAFVVALLLAEVAARIALPALLASPPRAPVAGRVAMLDLVQPSPHADLVYELRRGLDCEFQGVRVATNAHGWRGPEVAAAKAATGFRVLGLGDSILFGWGVPWEQTGVVRLQQRLAAVLPQRVVEVIGTGVPGYNTAMQAELLRRYGGPLQPDVVLVDFCGNDFDLPNFLLAPVDFWRLDRSFLVDLVLRLHRADWRDPWSPFVGAPMRDAGAFESDPARVPAGYRHLVGPEAYQRALASIRQWARERGCRVLVTSHYSLAPAARAACAELALPTVELGERVVAWLRHHGDPPYEGSALTVRAGDPHPSAIVHDWWAEAVAAKLTDLRWLP